MNDKSNIPFSRAAWDRNAHIYEIIRTMPFNAELAAGTLSEARFKLSQYQREAEQDVRTAWTRVNTESALTDVLARQSKVSDDLLLSYREQFNVGRRSLLDVLDSQNTRYSVQVQVETSRFSKLFAQYQLLAATNQLLASMGIEPSSDAKPYARKRFDVPVTPEADTLRRRNPS